MNRVLLLHGVNLNFLGKRQSKYYGNITLDTLEELTRLEAEKYNFTTLAYQSNHEGNLIDKIQAEFEHCLGIIINPGAFTHSSYALHDALLDSSLPVVEVHLSDINNRERWRRKSVIRPACIDSIWGQKEEGYKTAVKVLVEHIKYVRQH